MGLSNFPSTTFSGTLSLCFSFQVRDHELREKRQEDTNGSKKLLVAFLTGYYSLEAKHADRWINMSHSRIRFVHVVKGIAKEKLYVCVFAYACVLFSALGETKEEGGGRGDMWRSASTHGKVEGWFLLFKVYNCSRRADGNPVLLGYIKVIILCDGVLVILWKRISHNKTLNNQLFALIIV